MRGTCELLSSNFPFFSSLEGPHKSVFTSTAVSFLFLISELLQELEGCRRRPKKAREGIWMNDSVGQAGAPKAEYQLGIAPLYLVPSPCL